MRHHLFIFLFLFVIGCSSDDYVFAEEPTPPAPQVQETGDEKHDEEHGEETGLEEGRLNAVKKAYQLTDLKFTPLNIIGQRGGYFEAGKTYKGVMYSSVKELGTYVGSNVSIHTLMTAINNPRSKIYTEDISQPPYHGTNCRSYYGTVCSGLVSYALGINYGSYDFPVSELMKTVASCPDSIQVADVLWKSGHVALITDIVKDENDQVSKLEISECIGVGCKRYYQTRQQFIQLMSTNFKKVFRYTEIYKNTNYTPCPEFVAVMDETPMPFVYNEYLCADKGDKACYLENEDVTINIFHDYEYLEVYKDGDLYTTINNIGEQDIVLSGLPYGDYQAAVCYDSNHNKSDFTRWKVVNIELTPDRANGRLYFKSVNAVPYRISFTTISGSRKNAPAQLYNHEITDEERDCGYLVISQDSTSSKFPYIHFSVSTEYGRIKHQPLNWFE